jgi:hypothetical protein
VLADKVVLAVGMGAFSVQMPSAAKVTEARPNAKTKIATIFIVFIFFSFQSFILCAHLPH